MTLHHGDCLDVMATFDAEFIDAIVTDPPYGLGFMGKHWDHGAPGVDFWREMFRVAKPGAHLLAFGGTRTVHRIAVAIEDAGWEIRDMLVWAYASGFPKSLDVSKAIDKAAGAERERVAGGQGGRNVILGDRQPGEAISAIPLTPAAAKWNGWGTALKPAWEPIVLARKPLRGTVAANVLRHGTGALNIDGTRIKFDTSSDDTRRAPVPTKGWVISSPTSGSMDDSALAGRWPANVILTDPTLGSDYSRFFEIPGGASCDWCGAPIVAPSLPQPSEPVGSARSRAVTGIVGQPGSISQPMDSPPTSDTKRTSWLDDEPSTPPTPRSRPLGTLPGSEHPSSPAKSPIAASPATVITTTMGVLLTCDTCVEATTSATTGRSPERDYPWAYVIPKADRAEREPVLSPEWYEGTGRANGHPTVKPLDLMRHLVRLVTPPGGTVFDPFLGSGTTALAAEMEGFAWVGIEREAEYVAIAEARLNGVQKGLGLSA